MASWTMDPDITITFYDNSVRKIIDTPVLSKCSQLYAGFAGYGKPNITQQWNSNSSFLNHYGSDVTNVEKYGYAGLYASHALQGGGEVWFCRLLPEDAGKANLVISVYVKEDDAIPLWERNEDNSFKLDDNGNKIPIMIDDPDAPEEENGEKPQIQATRSGYRIKWVAEQSKDGTFPSSITVSDGWTIYPLLFFHNLYAGTAGNKFGFKITNDFSRDEEVDDGRRYTLNFYRASPSGVIETWDNTYSFAFNPEALVSKYYELAEGLQFVYNNLDPNNGYQSKDIQLEYSYKNYNALLDKLDERFDSGDRLDIDILSAKDKYKVEYDELIIDPDSINFVESAIFLEGGHDGSLGLGNRLPGTDGEIVVDEAHIEKTQLELIKKYYTGQIDEALEDCRKIQAGMILDCNYPLEIKKVIADVVNVRDDIIVMFDCGITNSFDDATKIITAIKGSIDTSNWRYAIFPHCGFPVDAPQTNYSLLKVTQTYEVAYSLPRIYKNFEAFCIYAGFERGLVETFIPDWYISNNTLKKRARTLGVNFITDYGNVGGSTMYGIKPLWVDADQTLYNESGSVMKSLRNAIVAGDLHRLVRTLFVKYRFGNSAEADMQKAGEELTANITSRYPSTFVFEPSITQDERDKILGGAHCYIIMRPPNTVDKWRVTIEANRQD